MLEVGFMIRVTKATTRSNKGTSNKPLKSLKAKEPQKSTEEPPRYHWPGVGREQDITN